MKTTPQKNKSSVTETASSDIKKLQKQSEEYLNGWKRALADFANLKKEQSTTSALDRDRITAAVFKEIIPIIELAKQSLIHVPETLRREPWYIGLRHINEMWSSFLKDHDIKILTPEGVPFDPQQHDAVETLADPKHPDQHVVKTITSGYTLKEKLLVPAKVIVNNNPK
jgi:molecular chaperone GrpE